jgi:hypothetical protein
MRLLLDFFISINADQLSATFLTISQNNTYTLVF